MINTDLTAKAVVNILGVDDPKVGPEGIINLEIEVSTEMLNFPRLMDTPLVCPVNWPVQMQRFVKCCTHFVSLSHNYQ